MLCPFCAEEIKREATYCKHCHRDVPAGGRDADSLVARLDDLEARLVAVETHLRSVAPIKVPQGRLSRAGFILITVVAASAAGIANYFWWQTVDPAGEALLYVLAAGSGLVGALLVGITTPTPRFGRSVILGAICALAYLGGDAAGSMPFEWLYVLTAPLTYVFGCAMAGAFGGVLGDKFVRGQVPSLPEAVHRVVSRGGGHEPKPKLTVVADLAKAVTPLVTAIVPLALFIANYVLGEKPPG